VSRDADFEIAALGVAVPTIDVSQFHDLGSLVQEQTGIRHESPQAIVVKDGRPAWHASHYNITREAVAEALAHQ
jgi:bacillithiol system protein YtxJ